MIIYGGYSALLRGEPFPRAPRDIDVFGTADNLVSLLAYLRNALPWNVTPVPWDAYPERVIIRHPSYKAPAWWKTIEFETVGPEFLALAESLPGTGNADIGGFACQRSGLDTDMLIKLAAIEAVPNVNPKHRADLDDFGWSPAQCGDDQMRFFDLFKSKLIRRYATNEG